MVKNIVKQLAFCEVFESKYTLYHDDNDYHINKFGSFITQDFDITISSVGSSSNGSVTIPQNFTVSQPISIGCIINVTIVNVPHTDYITWSYPINNQNVLVTGSELSRAFVVSNIDGNKLVLTDYCEFNYSFTNIGYVGSVIQEPLLDILQILTQREFRAFVAKNDYTYKKMVHGKEQSVALNIHPNVGVNVNTLVSFSDDFTTTNVTPYSVITVALQNSSVAFKDTNAQKTVSLALGARVLKDDGGYYVFEFLHNFDNPDTRYLRIKPSITVKADNATSDSAATIWIQPDENADDYIRAHVVCSYKSTGGGTKYATLDKIPEDAFKGNSITSIKTILIGYSNLFNVSKDKIPYAFMELFNTPDDKIFELVSAHPELSIDNKREKRRQDILYQQYIAKLTWERRLNGLNEKLKETTDPAERERLLAQRSEVEQLSKHMDDKWDELNKAASIVSWDEYNSLYKKTDEGKAAASTLDMDNPTDISDDSADSDNSDDKDELKKTIVERYIDYFKKALGEPLSKQFIKNIIYDVVNFDEIKDATIDNEIQYRKSIGKSVDDYVKARNFIKYVLYTNIQDQLKSVLNAERKAITITVNSDDILATNMVLFGTEHLYVTYNNTFNVAISDKMRITAVKYTANDIEYTMTSVIDF